MSYSEIYANHAVKSPRNPSPSRAPAIPISPPYTMLTTTSPQSKFLAVSHMKQKVLIFLISIIACTAYGSNKPDIIFLLGGQSNMRGNGFTPDLPKTAEYKKYLKSPKNVSIWDAKQKKWKPLKINSSFGPEIGFAHTLSKALSGKRIGIVKYAVGGTSMDRWKPEGELYTRLLSDFHDAKKSVPKATLAAMLWHQGESDSDKESVAKAYKAKLIKHIESIRRDTGEPQLLFILGQINPGNSFCGRARWKFVDSVRKAQAGLKLANTAMIKTDDFEKNAYINGAARTPKNKQIEKHKDNVHYSAKGQIDMGKRFAETYIEKAPPM